MQDGGPLLPHHSGAFQGDIYIWIHSRSLLQHILVHTERDLKRKGLDIHPGKTQHIYMDEGQQELEIGEKVVKGLHQGTLTALGTPIAMEMRSARWPQRWRTEGGRPTGHTVRCLEGQARCSAKSRHTGSWLRQRHYGLRAPFTQPRASSKQQTIQLTHLRNMLKPGRRPTGAWAEWNIRTGWPSPPCKGARRKMEWENIDVGMAPVGTQREEGRPYQAGHQMEGSSVVENATTIQERTSSSGKF